SVIVPSAGRCCKETSSEDTGLPPSWYAIALYSSPQRGEVGRGDQRRQSVPHIPSRFWVSPLRASPRWGEVNAVQGMPRRSLGGLASLCINTFKGLNSFTPSCQPPAGGGNHRRRRGYAIAPLWRSARMSASGSASHWRSTASVC